MNYQRIDCLAGVETCHQVEEVIALEPNGLCLVNPGNDQLTKGLP
jgi:hypothetical protein